MNAPPPLARIAPNADCLSVIIPAYNEERVVRMLADRLRPVLDSLSASGQVGSYEVVVVDDGSVDGTVRSLEAIGSDWPQLRLLLLRRNAGQQLALAAGLGAARGDWVATMDADLQDPPELLPQMLEAATRAGVDVVYTCHADRASDGWFKATLASCYYRFVRAVTKVRVEPHVGDYRLMSRRVVDALQQLPERHRIHRLLLPWLGFSSITLTHRREARAAGRTHYSLPRLVALTVDSIVSFTTAPLRWVTALGLLTGALSLLLAVGSACAHVFAASVPGWASLATAITFFGGVQLICIGILGEYVGRIFGEVQRRPLYDVAEERRPGEIPAPPRLGANRLKAGEHGA